MADDYCPARVSPHPAGVPRDRQIRAVRDGADWLVGWLDHLGRGPRAVRVSADAHTARQAGCRCAAHPRLLSADLR